ncbi:hypothetical protein C8R43DRAFT_497495 [Mycena crocata]|nr:hypothetical protein C8R43DRAFT_497495 [Mycena crocata]
MKLRPRGRHKGRAGSARSRSKSRTRQRIGLSSDAIQEALYVLRDSADVLPPLKSAVGGVLAIWNLVDRVHSSDEEARALAWKTVEILDAIYNAVDNDPGAIPHGLLQNILKFEKLLKEISDVMDACLKAGRLRRLVLLRKHESRLAQFNWQLDGVSEAFKIGALTRVELAVGRIPENLPSTTALAKVLEQSNVRGAHAPGTVLICCVTDPSS